MLIFVNEEAFRGIEFNSNIARKAQIVSREILFFGSSLLPTSSISTE
jgi:hypothetical protein